MRVLLLCLALLGCEREPAGGAPPAPPPHDVGLSDLPPTGVYEVTARVVADTCSPAYRPPAPWRRFVAVAGEKDVAKANVPLSAIPPSSDARTAARSDLLLRPRTPLAHRFAPPDCRGYTADRRFEVTGHSPDGFTVAISVTHGDAGACAPTFPANCTTEVEHRYALVESQCPASCYRGARPDPASEDPERMLVDCDCQ